MTLADALQTKRTRPTDGAYSDASSRACVSLCIAAAACERACASFRTAAWTARGVWAVSERSRDTCRAGGNIWRGKGGAHPNLALVPRAHPIQCRRERCCPWRDGGRAE